MNMNKVLGRMIYFAIIDYGENYNISYRGRIKYVYHSDNNIDMYVAFQNGEHVEINSIIDPIYYHMYDIDIYEIVQYINLLLHTRKNIFSRFIGIISYSVSYGL